MSDFIAIEYDAETGESIQRPMTEDEITQHKKDLNAYQKAEAEAQTKAEARKNALAKLAALGLTQEEIDAL